MRWVWHNCHVLHLEHRHSNLSTCTISEVFIERRAKVEPCILWHKLHWRQRPSKHWLRDQLHRDPSSGTNLIFSYHITIIGHRSRSHKVVVDTYRGGANTRPDARNRIFVRSYRSYFATSRSVEPSLVVCDFSLGGALPGRFASNAEAVKKMRNPNFSTLDTQCIKALHGGNIISRTVA